MHEKIAEWLRTDDHPVYEVTDYIETYNEDYQSTVVNIYFYSYPDSLLQKSHIYKGTLASLQEQI